MRIRFISRERRLLGGIYYVSFVNRAMCYERSYRLDTTLEIVPLASPRVAASSASYRHYT